MLRRQPAVQIAKSFGAQVTGVCPNQDDQIVLAEVVRTGNPAAVGLRSDEIRRTIAMPPGVDH